MAEEQVQVKRPKLDADNEVSEGETSDGVKGITELDVGIVGYVNQDLPGFKGTLKQRYTDFQVNEIDESGNVVHLSDLGEESPKTEQGTKAEQDKEEVKPETEATKRTVPDITEHRAELDDLLGPEAVEKIIELFSTGLKYQTSATFDDKAVRTQIHQLLKAAFNGLLETTTTKENNLIVRMATAKSRGAKITRGDKSLKFLRFTVYKENKDTLEVASLIAKLLRIKPRDVAFAGTKDRRGVTTQKFSLHKMNIARVSSLNNALKSIRLGDMHYHLEPMRLGDLQGNQFYIAIRDVQTDDISTINKAFTSLKNTGFINYFGLQRFGTFSISTHVIGKYILSDDYDAAVEAILRPQPISTPESREARKIWWETRNAAEALKLMPRKCVAEHSLLSTLQETPSAINALLRIPRNLRIMYVHAYQSYIWNMVASERLKRGVDVQEGDLVDAGMDGSFQRARPVTKEEVEAKKFDITDIILPTPGFDIVYPPNLEAYYEALMNADGIDCHKMRRNIKEFSLSGSYRNVMSKPENLEWWITTYEDPEEQLVYTDYDILQQGHDLADSSKRLVQNSGDGSRRAVVLKMNLGTSQYATMALREVMKTDTARHGGMYFAEVS